MRWTLPAGLLRPGLSARGVLARLPSPELVASIEVPASVPPSARVVLLEALADEGAADPQVRDLAFRIVSDNGGGFARCTRPTPNEPRQALQAILDALPSLVQYTPDPRGREVFSRVRETLAPVPGTAISPLTGQPKGRDDCEGLATLFSALARAAGLSAHPVWIDQEHKGSPLNHVAAVACGLGDHAPAGAVLGSVRFAPSGCAWIEATVPGAIVGESPPEAVARHGLPRVDIAPAGSLIGDGMRKPYFAPAGDPNPCAVTSAGEAFYLRPTATFTHTGLALQPRGAPVQVLARTQLQQSGSVLYLVRWTNTPYFAAFAPRSLGACADNAPRITVAAGMTAASALALVPGAVPGVTSSVPPGVAPGTGSFLWNPSTTNPLSGLSATGTSTPPTVTSTPPTVTSTPPTVTSTPVPTTPEETFQKPAPTASIDQGSGLDWKVMAAVGTGLVVAIGVGVALTMRSPGNLPRYNPRRRRRAR